MHSYIAGSVGREDGNANSAGCEENVMFPAGENTSMLCQHINISAQQYPDQLQHQQIGTQLYPADQLH